MTFTEAALEVLRSAGEPLHYKKITELAIARNLLSHVGKTPEVTMSARLATLVKKDRGHSAIVKVRPGVFAVRESHMPNENEPQPTAAAEPSPELEAPAVTTPPRPARPPMPGADVFPEEEGDDDPILAGVEGDAGAGTDERGRRRRRRRRRGGKGGEGDEAPVESRGPRPEENGGRMSGRPGERPARDERGGREERSGRDNQGRDRDRGRDERGGRDDRGRDRGRDDRSRDDRNRDDRNREHGRREERPPLDLSRQPGDGDLLGKDLADAAYSVLARGDRTPASFARVADMLVHRGRLSGSAEALAPTVAAALRADAARAQRNHARPRFRLIDQRVSLTEWLLPRDVVRCEENVESAAEQQRDQIRRAFVNRLNDLPTAGFAEAIATWLNAEGVTSLRAVRRPGSSGRELHLAGTLKRGAEETRLAVVVLRSGRDIDRELVVEVRGSIHHYGGATSAWLVTTARVAQAAREEGAAEHAAPCALLGGQDLARSMERLGIGLRQHFIPLCDIDFDLLEALGDAGLRRERSMRDDFRPRRDDEGRDHGRGERQPRDEQAPAAAAATGDDRSSSTSLDLLDLEAAEASRLSPQARSWDEGEEGDEEGDAPEAAAAAGEAEGADEAAAAAESDEDAELDFDRDRDEPLEEIDDGSDDENGDVDPDGDDEEPEDNGDEEELDDDEDD